MRNRLLTAALLCLISARAEAQFKVPDKAPGENFHVELGMVFWTPSPGILIQTGALSSIGESQVDFVQEFGIENKRFNEFRVVGKAGKNKFRYSHLGMQYNEASTLQRTIQFGGQTFPVSVPATADLKWETWRFGYEWDFVAMDRAVVGLITELKLNKVSANLTATGYGSEFTEVTAPVPAIGGLARLYPHKHVSITAEFTGFKVPGFIGSKISDSVDGDFDAKMYDLDIYGTVNFGRWAGAQIGYRSLSADYLADQDAGDLKMQGMYFGGLVRF
jgi:hypothetical protein